MVGKHTLLLFSFILMWSKKTCLQSLSTFEQYNHMRRNDWINLEDTRRQNKNKEEGFDLNGDQIRKFKLWHKGVIPYLIDDVSYSDKVLRDRIRLVLNTVNSMTGISFTEMAALSPKEDKIRWVFFVNRAAQLTCGDHDIQINNLEGVQEVRLGYDCMSNGNELAEAVLAIVGVPPQHNAPNRDEYIQIHRENIIPEKIHLFEKIKEENWLFKDLEYDFSSAGHYHNHRHSANGRATISVLEDKRSDISLGEIQGFSSQDINKIRLLYNYISKEKGTPECDKLFNKKRVIHENALSSSEISFELHGKISKLAGEQNDLLVEDGVKSNLGESKLEDSNIEEDVDDRENDVKSKEIYKNQNLPRQNLKKKYYDKNKVNIFFDPLSELSDYHSGDRNYERKVLKQT